MLHERSHTRAPSTSRLALLSASVCLVSLLGWLLRRRPKGRFPIAGSASTDRDEPLADAGAQPVNGGAEEAAVTQTSAEARPTAPVPGLGDVWDHDIARSIPILLVVLLLLKAYVVAGYSLVTASALVTSAPVAVLVGTVTSFLNIVVLVVFAVTSAWLFGRWRNRSKAEAPGVDEHKHLSLLVFAVWTMCLLFLPVPWSIEIYRRASIIEVVYTLLVIGTGVSLYYFFGYVSNRLKWRRIEAGWFGVLVGVALLLPTLKTPWMPSEIWVLDQPIATRDLHPEPGSERVKLSKYPVVFVLSVNGDWAVGMDVKTRLVLHIPAKDVKARVVCKYADTPPNTLPLWAFLSRYHYKTPNKYCGNLLDPPGQLDQFVPKVSTRTSAPAGATP